MITKEAVQEIMVVEALESIEIIVKVPKSPRPPRPKKDKQAIILVCVSPRNHRGPSSPCRKRERPLI